MGKPKKTALLQILRQTGITDLIEKAGLKQPLLRTWGALQHMKPSPYEADFEADYRAFEQRYGGFLHLGKALADPNRIVLAPTFPNNIAHVKTEALLLKTMQLHGLTPVIVANSTSPKMLRYYRLFGIDRFVFFDERLKNQPSPDARKEVETFFAAPFTVQDIKEYRYRGTHLGAHVLRTITRRTFKGDIDVHHPETRRELRTLMLQGMENVEQAETLLDEIRPEVIFTLHPLNMGEGDIYEVGLQRGINTIQWSPAPKRDYWIFKRYTQETNGFHYISLSDESWETARQMEWTDEHEAALGQEIMRLYDPQLDQDVRRLQKGKTLKSKEAVQNQLGLDPAKKTAVVFAHITWDTSFLHGVDLFNTYEEWLVETTRAACANPAVNWVIKLHPANIQNLTLARQDITEPSDLLAIRTSLGDLPDHVKLLPSGTDINTLSIYHTADYGVTVRGTVGIEMPCLGIPVLTAGTGRYSGRGFTVDSATREEYLARLAHIQDISPLAPREILLAKKHFYFLFTRRMVKWNCIRRVFLKPEELTHPLFSNFEYTLNSFDELRSASDLNDFADWVLHSRELDYYRKTQEVQSA